MRIGDLIKFEGENLPLGVVGVSKRFAIAVRPLDFLEDAEFLDGKVKAGVFNGRREAFRSFKTSPVYTIIDRKKGIRGPHNLVFNGFDFDNKEDTERLLVLLENGNVSLSKKSRVGLKLYSIYPEGTMAHAAENCAAAVRRFTSQLAQIKHIEKYKPIGSKYHK